MPAKRTIEDARRLLTGPVGDCWFLPTGVGHHDNGYGYSILTVSGRRYFAHRLSYELHVGQIPEGFTVDHTCHNRDVECPGGTSCPHRKCFNPDHLEAVPQRVNVLRGKGFSAENARKIACDEGHEFATAASGKRYCPICRREWKRQNGDISALGRKVDRTHCPQRHEYTRENTYVHRGRRSCRTCSRERMRYRRSAQRLTEASAA